MEATYLGDIELTDETLAHYGVKGMKWKYHKPKVGENASAAYKQLAAMSDKDYNDILSRVKLTKGKGGKSATAKKEKSEKTSKGSSEKKEVDKKSKETTEKKETVAEKKTSSNKKGTTSTNTVTKINNEVYENPYDKHLGEETEDIKKNKQQRLIKKWVGSTSHPGVKKIFARM